MKVIKSEFLGTEGSGIIVEVGHGVDRALIGRKVAYLFQAYSVYKAVHLDKVLILDSSQDLREGALAFALPMTALGLVHFLK